MNLVKNNDFSMGTIGLLPEFHNWEGPMLSALGGRRNRREQRHLLFNEIQSEIEKE